VLRDDATAAALERAFEADLAVSREVTAADFAARGRLARVVEGAARLLSPLM
jgi:hypothetical protein